MLEYCDCVDLKKKKKKEKKIVLDAFYIGKLFVFAKWYMKY